MKRILYTLLFAVLVQACGEYDDEYTYNDNLDPINWTDAADKGTKSLVDHFWNTTSNYFNYGNDEMDLEFHYWPQAHALDVLVDASIRTGTKDYYPYFDKWYQGVKVKNGNTFLNNFYDDMEWNALSMLRVYELTKDEKYLNTSIELLEDIKTGWNDLAEGGVAWTKSQKFSKNACSNGPAAILAARLYKYTKKEEDKQFALDIYDWMKNTLFNPSTGAVYDNINGNTGAVSTLTLSYNQGTFIGTALELYTFNQDYTYLKDAIKAADYAITNKSMLDGATGLLRDEGNGDGALFKGIFIRYFKILIDTKNIDPMKKTNYLRFFNKNAEALWRNGTLKEYTFFGKNWNEAPFGIVQLTQQVSGCMMLEARAALK